MVASILAMAMAIDNRLEVAIIVVLEGSSHKEVAVIAIGDKLGAVHRDWIGLVIGFTVVMG